MAREREAGIPRIPGTYEASPPSPAPLPAQTVPRLPAPPRRASSLCSETPAPACDLAGTCQHREDGGMDPARRSLTPTVETRARAPRPAPKGAAARRVLSCASQACGSWFAPGAFPGTRRWARRDPGSLAAAFAVRPRECLKPSCSFPLKGLMS